MLHAILAFIDFVLQGLLTLVIWTVIAYAVLSWLIAFNVVNLRNNAVWQISKFLERVVRPMLRPFQRILPSMGGMDFSPVVLILIVGGIQRILLPALFEILYSLIPNAGPYL